MLLIGPASICTYNNRFLRHKEVLFFVVVSVFKLFQITFLMVQRLLVDIGQLESDLYK